MLCTIKGQVLKCSSRKTKSGKDMYTLCILPDNDLNTCFVNSMSPFTNLNNCDMVELLVSVSSNNNGLGLNVWAK